MNNIKFAAELVKVARELVGGGEYPALYSFAEELGRQPGVESSVVDDFVKVSNNPTVIDADVFVYINRRFFPGQSGGGVSLKIKSLARTLAMKHGLEIKSFWTPRQDRPSQIVPGGNLQEFYSRNPYKITVLYRER